jgi:hypothetical protein
MGKSSENAEEISKSYELFIYGDICQYREDRSDGKTREKM